MHVAVKPSARHPIFVSTQYDAVTGPVRRLGVVIVSPRENRHLDTCLVSLMREMATMEGTPVTVAVAAPGLSHTRLVEFRREYPGVDWLTLDEHASTARALNAGLARVLPYSRFVLLCAGDIEIQPGAVRHMIDFLHHHPDADGCVGGLGDVAARPGWTLTRLLSFLSPRLTGFRRATSLQTAWCMLRAEAFYRVGGFDEALETRDCESEWAYRARKGHLRLWYLPDARAQSLSGSPGVRERFHSHGLRATFGARVPRFDLDLVSLLGENNGYSKVWTEPQLDAGQTSGSQVQLGFGAAVTPGRVPSGNDRLDDRVIAFISCVSEPEQYLWCRRHIEALEIPPGYRVEVHFVLGAKGLPSAYNTVMRQSKAKYKVYVHHDVYLLNRRLLYEVLDIFSDPSIGMIGVVGATQLPENGVWFRNNPLNCFGLVLDYRRSVSRRFLGPLNRRRIRPTHFRAVPERVLPVVTVDGFLMITQYDVPWREDLYDGFIYYEGPHCLEFIRRGLAVVVARQERDRVWCLHYGRPDGKERTSEEDAAYHAEFDRVVEIFRREYAAFLKVPAIELLKRYRGTEPHIAGAWRNGSKV